MRKQLRCLVIFAGAACSIIATSCLISWGFQGPNLLIHILFIILATILISRAILGRLTRYSSQEVEASSSAKPEGVAFSGEAHRLRKRSKKNLVAYAEILFTVLTVSFFGTFMLAVACEYYSQSGRQMISSNMRFPLGKPEGIAVDSKGRIYCVARPYNRVQVYSAKGKFVIGWFVALPKGSLHLDTDEDDNLLIMTAKGLNFMFDPDGQMLEEESSKMNNFFEEFGRYPHYEAVDARGNVYQIRSPVFSPKVVKLTPEGEEDILVSDPLHLWILGTPVPSLPLAFVGLVMANILNAWAKKRAKR